MIEGPPRIFRAPLRSAGLGVDHEEQVAYARKKGVVGPGWGFGPDAPAPRSLDEALDRLWQPDDTRGYSVVARFAKAPTGSLVWSRDVDGRYLVGQLVGKWRYHRSRQAAAVDLQNVRPVRWAPETVLEEVVPAAVVRAWAGRSTSFHEIHDSLAQQLSIRLYDKLMGKKPAPLELTEAQVLRELHPFDAEDLVCVFLQVRHNYIVLPGSHRSNTPVYEQLLISRDDGHRAIFQVKTGNKQVDLRSLRKAAGTDARAFAYSTTGAYSGDKRGLSVIEDDELLAFAKRYEQYLPKRVRRAFEYSRKSPGSRG
jgi:hypothetical protein